MSCSLASAYGSYVEDLPKEQAIWVWRSPAGITTFDESVQCRHAR